MIRLVTYDFSSDEADCSGNEDDEGELKSENCGNEILDDEAIVSSLLKDLVLRVTDDEEFGHKAKRFVQDRVGRVDMRWRAKSGAASDSAKARTRRKRRRDEVGRGGDETSNTEWSDLDSWSSDSSTSSSSSSDRGVRVIKTKTATKTKKQPEHEFSEDSDYVYARIVLECQKQRQAPKSQDVRKPVKTKGELDLDDLPPIENLSISVPENVSLRRVGVVSSIVDKLVVIQSDYGVPPLDEETWLVDENKRPIGQIFEVFGPVPRPFYSIRFNKEDEARKHLRVGIKIFFIPDNGTFTKTIFADALRHMKGSDASWEDNNEPPVHELEFSDDEEERRWKAQQKAAKAAASSSAQDGQAPEADGAETTPVRNRARATPTRRMQRGRGRNPNSFSFRNPEPNGFSPRHPVMQNPWASFESMGPRNFRPPAPRWPMQQRFFSPPTFRTPLPPPSPALDGGPFPGGARFGAQEGLAMWRPPRFNAPGRGPRPPTMLMDKRYLQNQ